MTQVQQPLDLYTVCTYNCSMDVIWDPVKARANWRKHGVDFADAAVALQDEYALTIVTVEDGEQRFKSLAMSPENRLLLIVYAEDDENTIAIISARLASASQKRQYYENNYDE